MLFETPTRSIGNMPDSHIFMTVGHVGNGPDIASAKDIQATFLIASLLAYSLQIIEATATSKP